MDAAIANKVIDFIFFATGRYSIICNVDGVIVAAKIASRVGNVHPGAQKMLRENLPEAMISEEDERACGGVMKAGANLPIWHNGKLIGSIGITGDPERTEPLTRLASGLISKELREREMLDERTRLHEQLHQSQKMESLGILAGGVAHDMNNVLGAILALASANLEIQSPASPTYRSFDTITKAATRGGQLVKSLLAFARNSLAEERALSLNEVLREDVRILEHTTLSKVRLVLDLDPALRPIRGDGSALAHTIMNLCVNAVDAMAENGTLTLRTRNVDEGWVEVMVEDTGSGMSPEVMAKAMDPFFTTKEVGKGTGLGLSIVYRTVKFHHGHLDIQSEPGQGTRVSIRFPVCHQLQPAPDAKAESPAVPPHGAMNVLLVDDDELIQSSVQATLKILGHRSSGVYSGEAALAKIEAGYRPDVVILDMNMPGLGGRGTLPRLQALCPTLPILLATGRVDQFASDQVSSHPGVTLLSKPFSMKELQEKLSAIGNDSPKQVFTP
jgi:signal transduction histidine kinase/ActR/RegA family two-component response regulator